MVGIIGKKIRMTSVWQKDKLVPCTVVEIFPCVVTQIKTQDKDGYEAVQIGYGERKKKNTTKPLQGHFDKAQTSPKGGLVEFRNFGENYVGALSLGTKITLEKTFQENEEIQVVGTTKGKGFQGVMKRHGFKGVGQSTHGQHNRDRAGGSIGAAGPSRVFKNTKMPGQTGNKRCTVKNCKIIKIIPEENLLVLKGCVPGNNRSTIILQK